MPSSSKEHFTGAEDNSSNYFGKKFFRDLVQILTDSGIILMHLINFELSLSERIYRYGKIRFLVVCDENMGRSPLFEIALKNQIAELGLANFVEVLSAGTDVVEKGS